MNPFYLVLIGLLLLSQSASAAVTPAAQELDYIVVIVNDDVVTQTELEQRLALIKLQLSQRNPNLPPDAALRKQVLEHMVMEKVQLQVAQRAGIRINDETINNVINNIARENRLTLAQFRQVLARDGMAFSDFRENIKTELTLTQLRQRQVDSKISVSEQEVDNFLANKANRERENEEYQLSHILIATPEAATPAQIQAAREKAEQVRRQLLAGDDFNQTAIAVSDDPQALKGGDLGWRKLGQLPTFFSAIIPDMPVGGLSEPVRSASGFHIIKLLDKRQQEQSHIVEQTLARHILITPNQIISNDEARRRLQKLRERILDGEDFGQLAQAHSDDTGSAAKGGSLGWFGQGAMVPRFEEEMNKLKPGEISQPFRTQFGWHIVQVMSRRKHDDTEQFQRNQARQMIGKRKAEEAAQDWLRRLRSESFVEYRLNH